MNSHEDRDTGQKVSMEEEKGAKEKDLDETGYDGDGRRGRYRYEGTRGPRREGWAVATSHDVHEQRADAEETEVMHSSADADRQEVARSSMDRSGRVRVGILEFKLCWPLKGHIVTYTAGGVYIARFFNIEARATQIDRTWSSTSSDRLPALSIRFSVGEQLQW